MRVDKPPWVCHSGRDNQIYGMDCSAEGARCVTAGGDNKVKIWALPPLLSAQSEADQGTPKLLATLGDHFGSVNACRFTSSGRRLATGADDKLVFVYELRAGQPRAVFGSTEPAAVENWQARLPPPPAHRPRCGSCRHLPSPTLLPPTRPRQC
jgi:protein HIRA/HIR1